MTIKEVELPGIGTKYTLTTQAKGQVVVVVHRTGKREIYYFALGHSVPTEVIDLTAEEAQQLGGLLGQTSIQPDPSRELVMKELTIDWLTLPQGHMLTDKGIRAMAIRQRTGASVVAILRASKALINPDPDEVLRAGDTLMVIGNAEQIDTFKTTFHLLAPEVT